MALSSEDKKDVKGAMGKAIANKVAKVTNDGYHKDVIHKAWTDSELKNKQFKHDGVKYRVGKMSYGDYFLEPRKKGAGERVPFASGTKWLRKHDTKKDYYTVGDN